MPSKRMHCEEQLLRNLEDCADAWMEPGDQNCVAAMSDLLCNWAAGWDDIGTREVIDWGKSKEEREERFRRLSEEYEAAERRLLETSSQ